MKSVRCPTAARLWMRTTDNTPRATNTGVRRLSYCYQLIKP